MALVITEPNKSKSKVYKVLRIICGYAMIYFLSYVADSYFGGYWLRPEMDGRDRIVFAMQNAVMWQPRFGHESIGHQDFLGFLYTPLLRLDRKFVHATLYTTEDAGNKKLNAMKLSQVHPYWRDEFVTRITTVGVRDEASHALRCTFHFAGADHPRAVTEIKISIELAKACDLSPPKGFAVKPLEEYQKHFMQHYIRWVGTLNPPKDQDVILTIPAKQPGAGAGRITFYYQRTDDASSDFRNWCSVELK